MVVEQCQKLCALSLDGHFNARASRVASDAKPEHSSIPPIVVVKLRILGSHVGSQGVALNVETGRAKQLEAALQQAPASLHLKQNQLGDMAFAIISMVALSNNW